MLAPSSPPRRTVAVAKASTDDVPAAERLRYWEAYTASELIGIRCSSYAAGGLRARQRNIDLGLLRLAEIAANEHVVERTQPIMKRHPKDSVFASMLIDGEAFFYQSGLCVRLRAGDLVIYGTMTPYLYGMTRPSRHIQIDIAAAELGGTGRACELKAPVKIDGSLRAGRLLTLAMQRDMLEFIDAPRAERAEATGQRLRATLELLIRAHVADRARGADRATLRLLRAEAFIAEHLCDAQLDVEAVARHLSMSPRHLNRLFERHGCSAAHWIWRERLARAHRLLADPMNSAVPIGDVALQCAFSTPSHFARAFKERYGITPSEHRVCALAPCAPAHGL
jgi:AraC-like DNA-binding protein